MTNLPHIFETAVLVLATYLLGCVVGYGVRWALHAGRGTRVVSPEAIALAKKAEVAPEPRRVLSPAARLARAASHDLTSPTADEKTSSSVSSLPAASNRAGPKPPAVPKPRNDGADNLRQIKGIGPKIEAGLNELGIYHFEQIAAWSSANIDWVDQQLSLRGRITRDRWIAQARALSKQTRLSA